VPYYDIQALLNVRRHQLVRKVSAKVRELILAKSLAEQLFPPYVQGIDMLAKSVKGVVVPLAQMAIEQSIVFSQCASYLVNERFIDARRCLVTRLERWQRWSRSIVLERLIPVRAVQYRCLSRLRSIAWCSLMSRRSAAE
jgi:hypothetical protein